MTTLRQRTTGFARRILPNLTDRVERTRRLREFDRWQRDFLARTGQAPSGHGAVLFHPTLPTQFHIAWKLAAASGFRITDDPATPDLVAGFGWEDTTFWQPDEVLLAVARRRRVLNLGATDISKARVNQIFGEVFGYPLGVEPLEFEGRIVAKSEENATHDGVVLQGPIQELTPGMNYQRLIDNTVSGDPGLTEVWRTPLIDGVVPLVYRKVRPVDQRLTNVSVEITLHEPDEIYTPDELDRLRRFAEAYGMDFGEVDVLRDREDGRIYVVDANDTPWGPPRALPQDLSDRAVLTMVPHFLAALRPPVAT